MCCMQYAAGKKTTIWCGWDLQSRHSIDNYQSWSAEKNGRGGPSFKRRQTGVTQRSATLSLSPFSIYCWGIILLHWYTAKTILKTNAWSGLYRLPEQSQVFAWIDLGPSTRVRRSAMRWAVLLGTDSLLLQPQKIGSHRRGLQYRSAGR